MTNTALVVDGREFFGRISEPSIFWDSRDGDEEIWLWPEEYGRGYIYMVKSRPGLMLAVSDYLTYRNIIVNFDAVYSPIFAGFCLGGNRDLSFHQRNDDTTWSLESNTGFISHRLHWNGYSTYPRHSQIRLVGLYFDPVLLESIMGREIEDAPKKLQAAVRGDADSSFFYPLALTPSLHSLLNQIISCPYDGMLKKMYYESKALDMMVQIQEQLVGLGSNSDIDFRLKPCDMKKIHEAGRILDRNLERPPSLMELARLVGTNKDKLNRGFRRVFGASAYEYLRINRLEKARDLLQSREKNVTEVAFNVGYNHPKNFARAFKRHFGINPSDYLH